MMHELTEFPQDRILPLLPEQKHQLHERVSSGRKPAEHSGAAGAGAMGSRMDKGLSGSGCMAGREAAGATLPGSRRGFDGPGCSTKLSSYFFNNKHIWEFQSQNLSWVPTADQWEV